MSNTHPDPSRWRLRHADNFANHATERFQFRRRYFSVFLFSRRLGLKHNQLRSDHLPPNPGGGANPGGKFCLMGWAPGGAKPGGG